MIRPKASLYGGVQEHKNPTDNTLSYLENGASETKKERNFGPLLLLATTTGPLHDGIDFFLQMVVYKLCI